MVWTPLQAALGSASDELTLELVQQACDERITERTGLDWKRDRPLTATANEARENQQQELAKDIAAMANSGGGVIVYGVEETRGTEKPAADRIVSVGEVGDHDLRTMRQVAGNLIYPAVTGIGMFPLTSGENTETVLAVVVPDSPSRPHLIHPRASTTGSPHRGETARTPSG